MLANVSWGTYGNDGYEGGYYQDRPWWADNVSQALNIFGNRYGRPNYNKTQQYPGSYGTQPSYGVSPGGVSSQGFQINWWMAGLIGIVIGAFLLGKRR